MKMMILMMITIGDENDIDDDNSWWWRWWINTIGDENDIDDDKQLVMKMMILMMMVTIGDENDNIDDYDNSLWWWWWQWWSHDEVELITRANAKRGLACCPQDSYLSSLLKMELSSMRGRKGTVTHFFPPNLKKICGKII